MEFRVSALNKAGAGKPSEVSFLVAKPPGAPGMPEVSDIDKNSATLTWTPPTTDGGSTLMGYVMEKREKGRNWIRVNKTPVQETTMTIQ